MDNDIMLGNFTCDLTLRRVRPPEFLREEIDGVIYLTAKDYEVEYDTTLEFDDGALLPIHGQLLGDVNRQIVIQDPQNPLTRRRGWVQGAIHLQDPSGEPIFAGSYYDVGLSAGLAGDEAMTATDVELVHWESGFGENNYSGHAFSMKVDLVLQDGALSGRAVGTIE